MPVQQKIISTILEFLKLQAVHNSTRKITPTLSGCWNEAPGVLCSTTPRNWEGMTVRVNSISSFARKDETNWQMNLCAHIDESKWKMSSFTNGIISEGSNESLSAAHSWPVTCIFWYMPIIYTCWIVTRVKNSPKALSGDSFCRVV